MKMSWTTLNFLFVALGISGFIYAIHASKDYLAIQTQKIDAGWRGTVYRFHDDDAHATCWVASTGIFCLPDSVKTGEEKRP